MPLKIVVLDDCEDLRLLMQRLLQIRFGAECVAIGKVGDLACHEEQVLSSQLIFLDINLGEDEPSGIDAYSWLCERGFAGSVYFFTGHAKNHPLVAAAEPLGVSVLEKPVKVTELERIVSETRRSHGMAV